MVKRRISGREKKTSATIREEELKGEGIGW